MTVGTGLRIRTRITSGSESADPNSDPKKNVEIQGSHDKSAPKEFVCHTIKNEAINLIFFVLHENNI